MPSTTLPSRPRVLLVEDDAGVRRSMHLMLHGRGYDVRSYSAAGPLLADPTIGEAKCLIADYRLPDSDGFGVLRALHRIGWEGRSILITAYPSGTLREAAMACGYDVILEKPIRQHELLGAIDGGGK
ncbi:response regulator [Sphingomonas sp. CJ20]